MRWERLFDDIEAQLAAADAAELAAEVDDRTRAEAARLRLADRLRGGLGWPLELGVQGTGRVRGRVSRVGGDCLLLALDGGQELVVAVAAISWVQGLPSQSTVAEAIGQVPGRLGLGHALRALAQDRAEVTLRTRDGGAVSGTAQRVGADFVELLPGEASGGPDRMLVTVPFAAVATLSWGGAVVL